MQTSWFEGSNIGGRGDAQVRASYLRVGPSAADREADVTPTADVSMSNRSVARAAAMCADGVSLNIVALIDQLVSARCAEIGAYGVLFPPFSLSLSFFLPFVLFFFFLEVTPARTLGDISARKHV